VNPDIDPILSAAAIAAASAYRVAMATMSREQRSEYVGTGGDGTLTFRLDEVVEAPVLDVLARFGVNVLSEEVGWVDRGSAVTVVIDPVDGTANAAAGVPLASFAAALAVDGRIVEGLALWLDGNRHWWARADQPVRPSVSARTSLNGASLSMLRPRPETWDAWGRVATSVERVRVLGTSVLEACLVADGAVDAFCDPGGDVHRIVDLAATSLIVERAGGVVVDLHGRPFSLEPDLSLRWSGIAAATPQLADELIATITA
jgi:myo-inositol-1(or 4)-monophosphatase